MVLTSNIHETVRNILDRRDKQMQDLVIMNLKLMERIVSISIGDPILIGELN